MREREREGKGDSERGKWGNACRLAVSLCLCAGSPALCGGVCGGGERQLGGATEVPSPTPHRPEHCRRTRGWKVTSEESIHLQRGDKRMLKDKRKVSSKWEVGRESSERGNENYLEWLSVNRDATDMEVD